MAPSPSADGPLDPAQAGALLDLAAGTILDELRGHPRELPLRHQLDPALREPRAVFVTLHVAGELQGCVGTVTADEPLGVAVARRAWSAAFADSRFPPLRADQYDDLSIEVSILSPLSPIAARTRHELLANLRPGIDGLVLADGRRRALFLPAVWDDLPDPEAFVDQLLRKAGIAAGRWSPMMQAWRFTTTVIERHSTGA